MALARWQPLREVDPVWRNIEQLLEAPSLLRWPGRWDGGGDPPALDMYETAEQVVIQVFLPGVRPEDIAVALEQHTVIIEGEAQRNRHLSQEHRRRERRPGKFIRRVTAPAYADMDHAEARFENGVLTIMLPKQAQATPRTLPLQA